MVSQGRFTEPPTLAQFPHRVKPLGFPTFLPSWVSRGSRIVVLPPLAHSMCGCRGVIVIAVPHVPIFTRVGLLIWGAVEGSGVSPSLVACLVTPT